MNILLIITVTILVAFITGIFILKYRLNHTLDKKNLEASLDAEINKLSKHDLSYAVVVGIYKEGKSFIKGYGTVDAHQTLPPDATTLFQLGSISKLFTASLLQILSDEGVVNMDATLENVVGDTVALSERAKQVTLRQLVTHTSGFPRIPKVLIKKIINQVGKKNLMIDPYSHLGKDEILKYLKNTSGMHRSGKFYYSNFGMGLLGHVLEMVTGEDLDKLASEKIFNPLGMGDTSISITTDQQQRLTQGYTHKGKAAPIWTFAALGGAGAFNSTCEDMMTFIRANIDDSSPLLESFKKMHLPQAKGDTGIGWMQSGFIDRFLGNQHIVWHNGMVGGYASYLSIDKKNDTGIVILSSIAIDPGMIGRMMTRLVRTQSWTSH